MMKKLFFLASISMAAQGLQADVQSQLEFVVQGEIAESCGVGGTSVSSVENVDLFSADPQTLGSVTYNCNVAGSFTRTISSANGGTLTSANGSIDYQISHGGGSGLSFGATQLSSPISTNLNGSSAFISGQTGSFNVIVPTAPDDKFAGTYSDTITISITAN